MKHNKRQKISFYKAMRKHLYCFGYIVLIHVVLFSNNLSAQDRLPELENKLNQLVKKEPKLEQKIDISVNEASIQEFIRAIGINNQINVSIDPKLDFTVINNFSGIPVKDVLFFLCKTYNLDIETTGSIIYLKKYSPPPLPPPVYTPKEILIEFDKDSLTLTLDLQNDTLSRVVKKITRVTGQNIIITPDLRDKTVNGYFQNLPLQIAIENLAFTNDMEVSQPPSGVMALTKKQNVPPANTRKGKGQGYNQNSDEPSFEYKIENMDDISIKCEETPISDIIRTISNELGISFFIFSPIKESTTVSISNQPFEELLGYILNGTNYTFKKEGNIFLIGDRQLEGLRNTKVIQLQHRSVIDIIKLIPDKLKKDIELKEFPDLNSIIASGSNMAIKELEYYLISIDKVVPMVLIEVLITDQKTGYTMSTGIKAGLGDEPKTTRGDVLPRVKMDLSSTSINNLINSFNGYGLINLGKVTPNFYLTISAMEDNGILKVRSTPKLSTLNGTEATMSIGNTEYYVEERNDVIGTQNPQNITTRQFKSVTAQFSLTIKPIVSGDDQITLEIKVEQSDFTGRISSDAPPGQVSRSFSSLIRVKNEEMILLGGLEEKSVNQTGSGLPWISRIPILKWFLGSQFKEKSNSKLNIFIKPTIIY